MDVQNAVLFEFGGAECGVWVGILNGRFHIQGGMEGVAVVDGESYDQTAYLITESFPRDGALHTVIIDFEHDNQGRTRLWIDSTYVGEGKQMTGLNLPTWGVPVGAYGMTGSNGVVVCGIADAWQGSLGSDLIIYSEPKRVGGCQRCINICTDGIQNQDEEGVDCGGTSGC